MGRLTIEELWKADFEALSEQIAREVGGSHWSETAKAVLDSPSLRGRDAGNNAGNVGSRHRHLGVGWSQHHTRPSGWGLINSRTDRSSHSTRIDLFGVGGGPRLGRQTTRALRQGHQHTRPSVQPSWSPRCEPIHPR
jgi:hypothetical protein